MGGNHGMQAYLWWRTLASTKTHPGAGKDRVILVRAIRHHDDHSLLKAGRLSEYLEFGPAEIADPEWIEQPWTGEQQEFFRVRAKAITLYGKPGAGKTTALWEHISRSAAKKTAYFTWSRDLIQQAQEYFSAFGRDGQEVLTQSFSEFLGRSGGIDLPPGTQRKGRERFEGRLKHLKRSMTRTFHKYPHLLYVELRARLYGGAVHHLSSDLPRGQLPKLSPKEYRGARGKGVANMPNESEVVLSLAEAMEDEGYFRECFPELLAARAAWQSFHGGEIPPRLAGVEQIVVDECQDLTLLETAALIELARAIGNQPGKAAPTLIFAGDEGQTVRPTGFSWGALSRLLHDSYAAPETHSLAGNLRSPAKIEEVIDRATELYGHVSKNFRPRKQISSDHTQAADARLMIVRVRPDEEAEILDRLAEMDRLALIAPNEWERDSFEDPFVTSVMTPAMAKGLEFQTVCVFDPGPSLAALQGADCNAPAVSGVSETFERHLIDNLRVALSRATENLVFLLLLSDEAYDMLAVELMGPNAISMEADDLIQYLETADITPEERVTEKLRRASAAADEDVLQGWQLAGQAFRLLGDPELPNGVSDPGLRRQVAEKLAELSFLTAASAGGDQDLIISTVAAWAEAIEMLGGGRLPFKSAEIATWAGSQEHEAHRLARVMTSPEFDEMEWPARVLREVSSTILKGLSNAAEDVRRAGCFTAPIDRVLDRAGVDAPVERTRGMAQTAVDTLTAGGSIKRATQVWEKWIPGDSSRYARILEASEKLEKAARIYERIDESDSALRCWRRLGNVEEAVRLANGQEKADLEWLGEFLSVMERRPRGHEKRTTPTESALIKSAAPGK